MTKFSGGDENYVRRKILSDENFVRRKIMSNEKFCPNPNFRNKPDSLFSLEKNKCLVRDHFGSTYEIGISGVLPNSPIISAQIN